MTKIIKNTFAGGEIAPDLQGRTDFAKYATAVDLAKNFTVTRFGALENRVGTKYIATTPEDAVTDTGKAVLVPFTFATGQNYMLEFTEGVMRVYLDKALVLHDLTDSLTFGWSISGSGTSEYYADAAGAGIVDPDIDLPTFIIEDGTTMTKAAAGSLTAGEWAYGDNDTLGFDTVYVRLSDSTSPAGKPSEYLTADFTRDVPWTYQQELLVHYAQSFDTLFMVESDVAPQELARVADDDWTIKAIDFSSQTAVPFNIASVKTGLATGRDRSYTVTSTSIDDESPPDEQITVDIDVNWPATGFLELFANAVTDTSRYQWTATTGFASPTTFYLELLGTGDPGIPAQPEAVYEDKSPMTLGLPPTLAAGEWFWGDEEVSPLGFDTIYVRLSDNADPDAKATGFLTFRQPDEERYNWYKNDLGAWGLMEITEFPWATDYNSESSTGQTFPVDFNPFAAAGDFPRAVGLFEQRLFFAGTDNKPQTVFGSRLNVLRNFNQRTFFTSDDTIEAELSSLKRELMHHMLPTKKLLVFSEASVQTFDHGANSDALSPVNIAFRHQSFNGVNPSLIPLPIEDDVVYGHLYGKNIFSLRFAIELGGFQTAGDLTLLAQHLFLDRTVVSWAYQDKPRSVIWVVMSDGALLSLTYLPEQEIFAWTRHETEGFYEFVATVRGTVEDDVYFSVRRTVDGSTHRFIEAFELREFDSIDDAFFVDSGLSRNDPTTIETIAISGSAITITATAHPFSDDDFVRITKVEGITAVTDVLGDPVNEQYSTFNRKWYIVANKAANSFTLDDTDGNALTDDDFEGTYTNDDAEVRDGVTTVTGLEHLEGEEVAILADGNVISGKTVSGGSVDLGTSTTGYSHIHVGLPYECAVETLPIAQLSEGTDQTKKKHISKVYFRFFKSRGGEAGLAPDGEVDESLLTPLEQRQNQEWRETGVITGDTPHLIKWRWDEKGAIFYRNTDPLPVTLLAIIMEIQQSR